MKNGQKVFVIVLFSILSSVALWIVVGSKTIYENFDGPYYGVVAKCFYDKACISKSFSFPLPLEYYPAHFPLYPVLMVLLGPLGLLRAGVLVNLVASTVGAIAIFLIWEKMKWGNGLVVAITALFLWPRMWAVRSIASPETLFILWTVLSLYFFTARKYWWAGIMGSLAVLTKSPGILLFGGYCLWFVWDFLRSKKFQINIFPVLLIPLTLLGLFYFFKLRTGDFWAYFNSGDNIHLQALPFKVFDSTQSWVGTFWLEDILWIYIIGTIGVLRAFRKNAVWGCYGIIFLGTIFFVSHRDISRYSLPLVPVVLLGLSEVLENKDVRRILALALIPIFLYSVNFLTQNAGGIPNWAPFL